MVQLSPTSTFTQTASAGLRGASSLKVTIEHLHGDGNSQKTVFATLVADMATTGMTVSALTEKMVATCMAGSALTEKIPAGIAASSLK
ncbi:hypothetical protein GN244_ATG17846 [Phytophthora infestans]|uniref:Uncharacterized protein n=1 Tax=Phytophthora infestans TaxID=4787 RepID=A0A833SGK4_PHYIN|nr:hypothetical protein GN244_ATG17846 [Phytophthora infestans]KAF4142672.1 hypothetical protein GN958_ATG08136 [Phytophthora infestans]